MLCMTYCFCNLTYLLLCNCELLVSDGSRICYQVDQPDPSAASKVAYYLTAAETGLSMYITLPSGEQILRRIEVFNPKKKVTVPGRK